MQILLSLLLPQLLTRPQPDVWWARAALLVSGSGPPD